MVTALPLADATSHPVCFSARFVEVADGKEEPPQKKKKMFLTHGGWREKRRVAMATLLEDMYF